MEALLSLSHVKMAYHTPGGEIPALRDVSFTIREGEFVSLAGASGCGKSTILNLIAGLLEPESGEILINGSPQSKSSPSIGYMLQKDQLFEWLTIYENVMLGLKIQKKMTSGRIARVDRLLESYGLSSYKNARPSSLSGGMRQRAALIRTLALDPPLLLLDEPFSALDYQTRLSVGDEIWRIIRQEKKTALMVTHDIAEAISMSDRVIILSRSPSQVRCEIPIRSETKSGTPMEIRRSADFGAYFNRIWRELNDGS